MGLILNIDTALQQAIVSITNNGIILAEMINDLQKNHASFLHVAINDLLKNNNINPQQLSAIATTIGPGSYTGIRVGLATAKGLCYALQKPLITINNLELMAKNAIINFNFDKKTLFCPMIDARRLEVFYGMYDYDCKELIQPQALVLNANSFEDILQKTFVCFFGDGMKKFKNICKSTNAIFIEIGSLSNALNELSFEKFIDQNFTDNSKILPMYAKEFFSN